MSDWQSIRGDAASLPTDPMNMTFRPTGVTIVGALICLAAIWQAIVGVFAIIVAISSNDEEAIVRRALDIAADICVFDPVAEFKVSRENLRSQGKNTPFLGMEFPGRVRYTLIDGHLAFDGTLN